MSVEIITEELQIPDLSKLKSSEPRSEGLHVSTVINSLATRYGHVPLRTIPLDQDNLPDIMILGRTWEEVVKLDWDFHFPGRFIYPGEISKDDLWGTVDCIDTCNSGVHFPGKTAIGEVKTTLKTSNSDPAGLNYWSYWTQVMAYCYMWDISIGCLYVLHLRGSHDQSEMIQRPMIFYKHTRSFRKLELMSNWGMLLQEAESLRGQ